MRFPKPESIKFESMTDIVDYTAKGMIPKKSDFNKVMIRVRDPNAGERDVKEVYVSRDILPDDPETREMVASILEQVDKDRRKNRRDMMIVCGVLAVAIIGGVVFVSYHHKKHEREEHELDDFFFGDVPNCESVHMNCEF